jgi:hypothetical protein
MAIPCKRFRRSRKNCKCNARSPKFQQMIADYLIYSQFQVEYLTICRIESWFLGMNFSTKSPENSGDFSLGMISIMPTIFEQKYFI